MSWGGLHGFTETMAGTWAPPDGSGRRVIRFHVDADATSAMEFLRRGAMRLKGIFTAEGLAHDAPARGEMEIQLMRRRIGYVLDFIGDDGVPYHFEGEKRLGFGRLLQSFTTLPGRIVDAKTNAEVGTAILRFDFRGDIFPFLVSWRLARVAR